MSPGDEVRIRYQRGKFTLRVPIRDAGWWVGDKDGAWHAYPNDQIKPVKKKGKT